MSDIKQEIAGHLKRSRTVVEFADDTPNEEVSHKFKRVYINGTPVLVRSDSIRLNFGDGELTTVELTIIPAEVHFINKGDK